MDALGQLLLVERNLGVSRDQAALDRQGLAVKTLGLPKPPGAGVEVAQVVVAPREDVG